MKLQEKIEFLSNKDSALWLKTRQDVFDELSANQSMWCCCGKLATGMHEDHCRKFHTMIDKETCKRLTTH